jgi:hypothetical protein
MKVDRPLIVFLIANFLLAFFLVWGATHWASPAPTFTQPIVWGGSFTTLLIFLFLKRIKSKQQSKDNFALVSFYLLSIFGKFVLAGIAVFVMLKTDVLGGERNVVFFMICYVAFTILEVVSLLFIRDGVSNS